MSASSPEGVPDTLWRYKALQLQEMPQIPMMGVHFSQQFLTAFILGLAFLCYFAWDRFNTRQSGATDFRYRVMKEVGVADLGGSAALRQAYFIYLITMLFLYILMTFFGKLIVQTLNELRVVGIRVDSSSLQFDSPQWPLLLAFGFAGLAPLIPPLQRAEKWLFQRAYRTVGIPVRINETTRNLISILETAATSEQSKTRSLTEDLRTLYDELESRLKGIWLSAQLGPSKLRQGLTLLAQLELLTDWARGKRGGWPDSEVSDSVRDLEQVIASQANDLLEDFEKYALVQSSSGRNKNARTEQYVLDALGRARILRDELVAILAVYFERDPTIGDHTDEPVSAPVAGLRDLLKRAEPPNMAGTGPETGVLICIIMTLPIYAILTWQGFHSTLSLRAERDDVNVVVATAGMSGLLLISIFWFPLLVAFACRQHFYDDRRWIVRSSFRNRSAYTEQRLIVVGMAIVASAFFLSLTAALWAFLTARDVSTFEALFVGGASPFLLYYASMALIAIPLVLVTLVAADARLTGPPTVFYGLVSALLVSVCEVTHLALWFNGEACTKDATFLTDLFTSNCFNFYNGFDFFVMPSLAFLAAVVFGNPQSVAVAHFRRTRGSQAMRQEAAIVALAIALLFSYVPKSFAEDSTPKIEVKIGFRSDVEPFSYQVSPDRGMPSANNPMYHGFLADLCYWIFNGSEYSVREVEVTATDRFPKLRSGDIEVLCDPVTMRFAERIDPLTQTPEPRRSSAGLFSPIVFASGISYLQRRDRTFGSTIYIGYVADTTAEDIVDDLCKVDLFGIVPPDERAELATMCATATVARRVATLDENTERSLAPTIANQPLLADVEKAADAERASVTRREEKASGSDVNMFKEAERVWNDSITRIKACETGKSTCDRDLILKQLDAACTPSDQPRASPASKQAEPWKRTTYRYCPFPSHKKLVDWFCDPQNTKLGMVYLGDREIILAKIHTWNETHDSKCLIEDENGAGDLTYEPYALMVAKPDGSNASKMVQIDELVQRRIYEFFSFSSLARAKFDAYFLGPNKDRTMSPALAYLFLLNGVEDERRFTVPMKDEEQSIPEAISQSTLPTEADGQIQSAR